MADKDKIWSDMQSLLAIAKNADAAGDSAKAKRAIDAYRRAETKWREVAGEEMRQHETAQATAESVPPLSLYTPERALIPLGRGMLKTGQGLGAFARGIAEDVGLAPEGTRQAYVESVREDPEVERAYQAFRGEQPWGSTLGEEGGVFMASGGPVGGLGAGWLPRILTGGAIAGTGAAGAAGPEATQGEQYGSGILGFLMGSAGEGAGVYADRVTRSREAIPGALAEAAEEFDVPVYRADIPGNLEMQRRGDIAAQLSDVARDRSVRQQDAAQAAATRMADEYVGGVDDIAAGLETRQASATRLGNRLYRQAAEELDPYGQVPLTDYRRTAYEEWWQEASLPEGARDVPTMNRLAQIIDEPDAWDMSGAEALRQALGTEISSTYKGTSDLVGPRAATRLQPVKEALDADMGRFAAGQPEATLFPVARDFWRVNVAQPYKSKGFVRQLLQSETGGVLDPTQVAVKLNRRNLTPEQARQASSAMTRRGREAVRSDFLERALASASDAEQGFSPARYASYLRDRAALIDGFFEPEQAAGLNRIADLMGAISGAKRRGRLTPTGLLGSAAREPITAGLVGAGAGALTGDTWQERLRNAGVGLGLAFGAEAAVAHRLTRVAMSDPTFLDAIGRMTDEGFLSALTTIARQGTFREAALDLPTEIREGPYEEPTPAELVRRLVD